MAAVVPLDPTGVIPPGPGVLVRRLRPGCGNDDKLPQKGDTVVVGCSLASELPAVAPVTLC
jgi:hypothetical protein